MQRFLFFLHLFHVCSTTANSGSGSATRAARPKTSRYPPSTHLNRLRICVCRFSSAPCKAGKSQTRPAVRPPPCSRSPPPARAPHAAVSWMSCSFPEPCRRLNFEFCRRDQIRASRARGERGHGTGRHGVSRGRAQTPMLYNKASPYTINRALLLRRRSSHSVFACHTVQEKQEKNPKHER